MNASQSKIITVVIFLLICALLINAYPVAAEQKGTLHKPTPRVEKMSTGEDRWTLDLERITESPGVNQWVGGQTGQGMKSGFRNVICKQTIGKATIDLGTLSTTGAVQVKEPFSIKRDDGTRLIGTVTINGLVDHGVFRFTPTGNLSTFIIADGRRFPMEEVLFSEPNVDFSIEMPFEDGAEAITSFTVIDQLSNTLIKTTLRWRINGPADQVWEVDVTGHERIWEKYYYIYESKNCQEPYDERLQSPKGKQPLSRIVENKRGAVFRFHLTAEITLKKRKGEWYYYKGRITQAEVRADGLYTPEKLVKIKKVWCVNCAAITNLPGSILSGQLTNGKLEIHWPDIRVSAEVHACSDDPCLLKTGYTGMRSCNDLSAIDSRYAGTQLTEFMERMGDHELATYGSPTKVSCGS